ncbi:MAG: prephenate dehydratase domain-containing protein [Candidatus Methanomethylophilaceae archaeon]|jgi:prephenate dehydratase
MKKIGYMGIPLSNSENASGLFAEKFNIKAEHVPLISAEGVVKALLTGEIDYGVVATRNIGAGAVVETDEALKLGNFRMVDEIGISIHHCLFVKKENVTVDGVASHIQALAQTDKNLNILFPDARRIITEDTALAAEMLADGRLSENTAVVCGMSAGRYHNLILLESNIEDIKENMTYFALIETC